MYLESFWINLLFFMTGQAVAITYMSTGLTRRGKLLMFGVFILADAALVARHAYQYTGVGFKITLLVMWAYAVAELFAIIYRRLHRRLKSVVRWRDRLFREAFQLYVQDDLDAAIVIYRKLARSDPWDLPVRVAYATALSRNGVVRKARRLFRVARALDRDSVFEDVIAAELVRSKQSAVREQAA